MTPPRRTSVVVAVAAALALTAGCTGGGARPKTTGIGTGTGAGIAVPALAVAWSAAGDAPFQPGVTSTSPPAWTTAGAVVVPQTAALTAYSTSTGARRWNLTLPQDLCAIADAPNAAGIAAVLLGKDTAAVDDESCAMVGAVDLKTGRLLWTLPLKGRSGYGFTTVAVGPRAVAVTNPCDTAITLSVTTGKRLATLAPHKTGDGCLDSFASDGTIVVDGVKHTAHDAFVGYDAVSGRRLWSVQLARALPEEAANPQVDRVLSSAPVVLDARVNGHRFLRTVDPHSRSQRAFGREANDSYPPAVSVDGSDVAVRYGQSAELFDYALASGAEVHHTQFAPGEFAVGTRRHRLITRLSGTGALAGRTLIRSVDLHTGRRELLGSYRPDRSYPFLVPIAVADDRLVLGGSGRVVAYRLPASGSPVSDGSGGVGWAPHDVRPASVLDLCTAVRAETKKQLRFAEPALAAPANCHWVESVAGGDVVQLSVGVTAEPPSGSRSAVQQARRYVARVSAPDTLNKIPALTPLTGVGDEAAEVGSGRFPLARLVTRRANVVIVIDLTSDGTGPRSASLAPLERGARLVAADLVAAVDRLR